ncbi:hypothetical protein [Jannaschia sp. W003]|uniref:hypothetical protein n=1 Tax=Jannaschia sp. W003 TaxID=2867012 RepID=UPI0021A29041|nr:hypothetical protein [Jannaschia sp. W003]UWQ20730.1 hypothetical protein K3554_12180 [Jannaschia sp. W003]
MPSAVPAAPPDPSRATLSEAWAAASDAALTGFALAAVTRPGPVLWVQDRLSALEAGRPYATGLARQVIHVQAGRIADLLAAMEMGLSCPSLAAVMGEVWGEAPRLDFTATKRLAMRAEGAGVPCWLLRRGAEPGLSAARERWRVASLPSAPAPFDDRAPGVPRWRAELFRSRSRAPGAWVAGHDGAAQDRLGFAPLLGDGAVAQGAGAGARRAAR